MFCYLFSLSLKQSYSKIHREGNNCSIVSRSGYIWIFSKAHDQESTNHSAHFVEWKSSYITIIIVTMECMQVKSTLYYMASSVSGQDETILPTWDYMLCPTRKICAKAINYNKSFIDQACSVKMACYWLCLLTLTPSRSINKHKKLGQCTAILTSHLVNNPYLLYG